MRPASLHFLLVIIGFLLAVLVTCLAYAAILSLPYLMQATRGWASLFWDNPISAFGTLYTVTAIAALPGWFIAAFIGELAMIRTIYFYTLVGLGSVLLAHFIFNSTHDARVDWAFLVPSMISGLFGGLAYWAFIGKQAGTWLPDRRSNT